MKALSVRAPWWWWILNGGKDVENRSRRTHYRGPALIHASSARPKTVYWENGQAMRMAGKTGYDSVPFVDAMREHGGHIVGMVNIVDCVQDSSSPFAIPEMWHWVLESPRAFNADSFQYKGALGLFNVPDDLDPLTRLLQGV